MASCGVRRFRDAHVRTMGIRRKPALNVTVWTPVEHRDCATKQSGFEISAHKMLLAPSSHDVAHSKPSMSELFPFHSFSMLTKADTVKCSTSPLYMKFDCITSSVASKASPARSCAAHIHAQLSCIWTASEHCQPCYHEQAVPC